MIGRIRDRRTFAALRRGVRGRSGPLTISYVDDRPEPVATVARVAFAVPRKVGGAVDRNLVRRRIRSILGDLPPDRLPPGAYLVAVRPGAPALSFPELRDHVHRALTDTVKRASAATASRPGTADRTSG